jgi:hypothetical protein
MQILRERSLFFISAFVLATSAVLQLVFDVANSDTNYDSITISIY